MIRPKLLAPPGLFDNSFPPVRFFIDDAHAVKIYGMQGVVNVLSHLRPFCVELANRFHMLTLAFFQELTNVAPITVRCAARQMVNDSKCYTRSVMS